MNINIVYATMTKHSKKLAEAIAKELNIHAQNVLDNTVLQDTDLLFIVGGIYGGKSLPILIEFVQQLDSQTIKKVALVTSCSSKKQRQDNVRKILNDKGIEVIDEFSCYGNFLFIKFGHPNQQEIQQAVDYAVQLAKS